MLSKVHRPAEQDADVQRRREGVVVNSLDDPQDLLLCGFWADLNVPVGRVWFSCTYTCHIRWMNRMDPLKNRPPIFGGLANHAPVCLFHCFGADLNYNPAVQRIGSFGIIPPSVPNLPAHRDDPGRCSPRHDYVVND